MGERCERCGALTGHNALCSSCAARLATNEERGSVIAWLLDPARYREACSDGPLMSESAFRWLADRIKNGEHLTGEQKP